MRARQELRAHFAGVAQRVQDEANGVVEGYIREALTEPMEEIREYSDELNRARHVQNAHIQHLSQVSKSARELIARIHEGTWARKQPQVTELLRLNQETLITGSGEIEGTKGLCLREALHKKGSEERPSRSITLSTITETKEASWRRSQMHIGIGRSYSIDHSFNIPESRPDEGHDHPMVRYRTRTSNVF